ncbi:hypothetical protein QYF36_002015 [Acer negundo]|nr:hypothetical protein QYF36_002015 [Acer negundo]
MNSSTFPFPWLHAFMFSFLITAFSSNSFLSSATPQVSYADHCNSLVPEATLNNFQPPSQSHLSNSILVTTLDGVFRIEGYLVLRSRESKFYFVGNVSHNPGSVSFTLHGFWSESSGEVCMVGIGFSYTRQGRNYNPEAVLKLNNLRNSSSVTTLVIGTLESLSSPHELSYFEPISILIFSGKNYEYTMVSKEFGDEFSGGNDTIVKGLPMDSLYGNGFCSVFSRAVNGFNLKYSSSCISAKNCNPFGDAVGFSPRIVYFKGIDCKGEENRMRVLVAFSNSSYVGINPLFDPNTAFVGEGFWDDKMNQLCIVACRFSNASENMVNAHVGVGDCTTRLSLSFPAVWSIRETNDIVGTIWSRKPVNDSGYFNRILFHSSENRMFAVPGLKFEYTEILRAGKLCGLREKPERRRGSGTQISTLLICNSIFGLEEIWETFHDLMQLQSPLVISPIIVSYKIGIRLSDKISLSSIISTSSERVEITAEGIYDVETGQLCMVGCRNIVSKDDQSLISDSMDCEIVVNFQFPPLKSKKNGGYIKGSITSTRSKPDPLYFERLDVSSASYTAVQAKESISRMDLEIILALISNTLVCVFVGFQLLHVKQHPHLLPFISLVMLLLLTLGHMIPLVLNFEALFLNNRNHRKVVLGSGIWLEANEVLVRLVTMVAFLLEFRLLQLTWSARLTDRDQKSSWFAERSTVFVSFPLYVAGALIFLLVNWSKDTLWEDLKSYTDLVLDGFLLPQILLNIFRNSKQDALSRSFYIGTTFFQLLPHAYDLYRRHSYCSVVSYSYIYASPNADFYSATWDVIIPSGGLLFVAIIYLQQRFGGCCIIPGRFREDDPEMGRSCGW